MAMPDKVRDIPKKRLPVMTDRAVWDKITNGQAGKSETVWKDIGGHQEKMPPTAKFRGTVRKKNIRQNERKG